VNEFIHPLTGDASAASAKQRRRGGGRAAKGGEEGEMVMPLGVIAGPFDRALMLVVLGTIAVAFTAHVLVLVGWIRRR